VDIDTRKASPRFEEVMLMKLHELKGKAKDDFGNGP